MKKPEDEKQIFRNLALQREQEAKENARWGVPNWRKIPGYPVWERLNKDQQKWEFLRRTSYYRDVWLRYEAANDARRLDGDWTYHLERFGLRKLIDPKTGGQDFHETFFRSSAKGCGMYPIIEEPESFLQSMRCDLPNAAAEARQKEMSELAETMGEARDDPYGLIVTVKFSLEFPPQEQADFVVQRLEKMQVAREFLMSTMKLPKGQQYEADGYAPIHLHKRNKGKHKKVEDEEIEEENHILLLRIFDAANHGLEQKEIVDGLIEGEIFPGDAWHPTTVGRKMRSAQNMWQQM